ncbi:conserved protein of unknown function (plasmid) [Cupriavidus taiwanensis]|uniref:DNA-binding protein H-NS-like C-terminal domain-containing protein n=1 Tax=Cupriavidus taiwanensis TaxID=164546 RepID=A0A7Z7NQ01_9BURK|nr:conserved hypothetical protein [Cupriavidus taiwanensis]SOZ95934.1 conserved hypothetical protein [Cupriavidus taiwanensis]SPC25410.1 conserved hypothetical protein [Cupriavidus taiwanensis]SPD37655.1 conserved protein of unknown function [Cupriavidus taiwanensis]
MTKNTERAAAIRWIQAQMANYGLTMEELDAAGCFEPPPPPPAPVVCYRNAEGLTWDGQGEMPSWLKRAVNAGQSVVFFRVGRWWSRLLQRGSVWAAAFFAIADSPYLGTPRTCL